VLADFEQQLNPAHVIVSAISGKAKRHSYKYLTKQYKNQNADKKIQ